MLNARKNLILNHIVVLMDFLTRVNQIVLYVLINALLVIKTVHIVLHVAMHQEIVALANVCKYLINHLF